MMKHRFSVNILLVLGCLAFVYWIYNASAPSGVQEGCVKLNVWVPWTGQEFQTMVRFAEEYNLLQDRVFVNLTCVGAGSQKERIALAGGDPPDLTAGLPCEQVPDYAIRGLLHPLDEFFRQSGRRKEDYPPAVWEAFTFHEKLYGLAMSLNSRLVVYNKKIFRDVGLDPERPPRTLEEFVEATQRCTRFKDDDPRKGIERLGFAHAGRLWDFGLAFGAPFWDPEAEQVIVNDATLVECLQWLKEQVDFYGYQKSLALMTTFGNTLSSNDPFISGKVAMELTGEWKSWVIDIYAPADFEWGAFPVPVPDQPGARPVSSTLSGCLFTIPEHSRNKEEAWRFLDWVLQDEQMQRMNELNPIWKSDRFEKFRTPYWDFVRSLYWSPNCTPPPDMPLLSILNNELNRTTEFVLAGQKSPREALNQAQAFLAKTIDDFYRRTR